MERDMIRSYAKIYHKLSEAKSYSSFRGWTDDDPNYVGLQGECAVVKYLGRDIFAYLEGRPKWKGDEGFDITIDGKTYDVKTRVSKDAGLNLRCFIPAATLEKDVYGYIFVTKCGDAFYPCGFISKEDFVRKAVFGRKGEMLRTGYFKTDTYHLHPSELSPMEALEGLGLHYFM